MFNFQGSDDNISVVLVTFPAAPTPSQDARRADHELEETIRKCITGCFSIFHRKTLHANKNPQTEETIQ